MSSPLFHLRPYVEQDFDALMDLWVEAWSDAYPQIDFRERLAWWKQRWVNELLPTGEVIVAVNERHMPIGFVTITPATGYLDQIVVAPAWQGLGVALELLNYAKGRSPGQVMLHVNESNARAIKFYEREGFRVVSQSMNERSKLPTYEMVWERSTQS